MATPTLSRIIPAKKSAVGVVEKWRMPDWGSGPDRVVALVPGSQENSPGDSISGSKQADSGAETQTAESKDGYAKGYEQGMLAATQEMKEQLANVRGLVEILEAPVRSVTDEVAAELLDLAIDIANSILKDELRERPEHLLMFIKDAVSRLPEEEARTRVAVNPQDLSRLRALTDDATDVSPDNSTQPGTEWVEDENLGSGKFIVSSGNSRIHGGIEEMLTRVCAGSLK